MNEKNMKQFCPLFLILFLIGFMCLLFGCSIGQSNYCVLYKKHDATIYKNSVKEHTCKGGCARKKGKTGCAEYNYYKCFDMTIYVNYHEDNNLYECTRKIADNSRMKHLPNYEKKYGVNNTITIAELINEHSSTCKLISDLQINWIVGVVFLSLTTIPAFLFFCADL